MADLDKLFEKSDISENKKKSKMIFGKLLIALRKNGFIKLYSLLGSVGETDFNDNVLKLSLKDNASYDLINNVNDIDSINKILREIDGNYSIQFGSLEKNSLDEFKFEEFLKDEFGKILTIK